MKIFIGLDFENAPIGVLLSDSKEKAEIAWAAMGETPHSIEEIDPNTAQGINGLVFLLTSIKANSAVDYDHKPFGVDFRIWRRGLK